MCDIVKLGAAQLSELYAQRENLNKALVAMSDGAGVFCVEDLVPTKHCKEIIELSKTMKADATGSIKRLLNRSRAVEEMVLHQAIRCIAKRLFGGDYRLSSLAVRTMESGSAVDDRHKHVASAHVDYPYRHLLSRISGNQNPYLGVPLGLQVLVPLVDLNEDTGATAYIPKSQKYYREPSQEEFQSALNSGVAKKLHIRAGTAAMWWGPLWHSAMPNRSGKDRIVVTMLFGPRFLNHPQMLREMYPSSYLKSCSPELQELIGVHDIYPKVY
ncbi:phytanoyl-CoA dioxygenase family protein [Epibacterium ulvae]|uniref:phytanoyl-CoA dioxygenase family protein n=1 Tax=Epibacterium ulvae TaxID=1156985 RepID=UPI00248FEBAA|nr:phytanoyl-CoA dioxygenase family protein [Epibacterium ulvae]